MAPGEARAAESATTTRARLFFRVRLGVLLGLLLVSLLLGAHDAWSRAARNRWERPLLVGFVFVTPSGLDPAVVAALRPRALALEDHLRREFERFRGPQPHPPISLVLHHVEHGTSPPPPPAEDGLVPALAAYWARRTWLAEVDARGDLDRRGFDSVVYVVARPPAGERVRTVEGQSEQGGRVGLVAVELDAGMVDLALIVATHELFHTLGATDRYDEHGRARVPDGLAEPDRVPLYPQVAVEVMARNIPVGPDEEVPPDTLDQLRVGPLTARELGWLGAETP